MTQMIHICDDERCISCSSCVLACKVGHEIPVGVARRRVYTINEGTPGERSISVACRHCAEPYCMPVCPVGAITQREDGIVQVNRETCISCQRCLDACPFGIPAFLEDQRGRLSPMDKCTFCAGGPDVENFSETERELYGQNRIAEGKPPLCSSMCATKALVSGDSDVVIDIMEKRVTRRYRMKEED
jgi:formate dehydrogenase iron-sulfur subunit